MFGAIGMMIVGAVMSFIPGMQPFIYTIMSTALSMATAICYGQYKIALKSLAIGVATAILQYAAQVVTSVVKGIMTGLTKVKDAFISIKNTAVNIWTTAVKEAGDFVNRAWLFVKNTALGFTTTGVSRYFAEEIDKNASWGAKIGYAFAGAYALTGISALTNSNFGVGWCDGNISTSLHVMTELAFSAMGMIASTEVYKALEDEWEEEWYRDFMFASINTMMNVGFNIAKGAVHQAIGDLSPEVMEVRRKVAKEYEGIRATKETLADGKTKLIYEDRYNDVKTIVVYDKDNITVVKMKISDEKVVSVIVTTIEDYEDNVIEIDADSIEKIEEGYKATYNAKTLKFDNDFNILERDIVISFLGRTATVTAIYNPSTHNVVDWKADEEWLEYYYKDYLAGIWGDFDILEGQISILNFAKVVEENGALVVWEDFNGDRIYNPTEYFKEHGMSGVSMYLSQDASGNIPWMGGRAVFTQSQLEFQPQKETLWTKFYNSVRRKIIDIFVVSDSERLLDLQKHVKAGRAWYQGPRTAEERASFYKSFAGNRNPSVLTSGSSDFNYWKRNVITFEVLKENRFAATVFHFSTGHLDNEFLHEAAGDSLYWISQNRAMRLPPSNARISARGVQLLNDVMGASQKAFGYRGNYYVEGDYNTRSKEFRWRIFSFEEIFGLHDAEIVPMDRALEILFRIDLEDK